MPARIICPGCGGHSTVPEQFLGKTVQCRNCNRPFVARPSVPVPEMIPMVQPVPFEPEMIEPTRSPLPSILIAGLALLLLTAGSVAAFLWLFNAEKPIEVAASPRQSAPASTVPAIDPDVPQSFPLSLLPFRQEKLIVPLHGKVVDLAVGGGGRFFVLHVPERKQLAVFDVNAAELTGSIGLTSDTVKFAAGQDKVMVVYPETNTIERWDLEKCQREKTGILEPQGPIFQIGMGSASNGPLYVPSVGLLNINTFRALDLIDPPTDWGVTTPTTQLRVSANGKVFAYWDSKREPMGVHVLALDGIYTRVFSGRDTRGHVTPGPDGRVLYTGSGLFTYWNAGLDNLAVRGMMYCIPAHQGPYGNHFLRFWLGKLPGSKETQKTKVWAQQVGDNWPLAPLDHLEFPDDQTGWDMDILSLDRRVHFIPDAQLIITLPTSNDRLVLQRFNLDEAVAKSGIDHLTVTSRPPTSVRSGTKLDYTIQVRSKKGGVRCELIGGPPGATLTPEGRLTWAVPTDFPKAETVLITAIKDDSGHSIWHKVLLDIKPAPDKLPTPVVQTPPPEPTPPVIPANLPPSAIRAFVPATAGEGRELPGNVEAVAVGGGGRYLALVLKRNPDWGLVVFDVQEARLSKVVTLEDTDVRIAAGATRVVVVYPSKRSLRIYKLDTLEQERSVTLQGELAGEDSETVAMGSATEGPLVITLPNSKRTFLVDLQSLAATQLKWTTFGDAWGPVRLAVAADGSAVAGWEGGYAGLDVAYLKDGKVTGTATTLALKTAYDEGAVPALDGSGFYTRKGFLDRKLELTPWPNLPQASYLPAHDAGFFLACWDAGKVVVHAADFTPLFEIPGLNGRLTPLKLPVEKRLHYYPWSGVLVAIGSTQGGRIQLHRVNLDELLGKSGGASLAVLSRPPASVAAGAIFSYPIRVHSSKGGVQFKLEGGPPGMTIEPDGKVSWAVPADQAAGAVPVAVAISDQGGKEAQQRFQLTVISDRVATAVPKPPDKPPVPVLTPPERLTLLDGAETADLKPPMLTGFRQTVRLPSAVSETVVGGGGRYLVLRLPSERKLAIFDVNQLTITKEVPLTEDPVRFTAGLEKLVVLLPKSNTLQRYDLATGEQEQSGPLPVSDGKSMFVALGSGSRGPLLVGYLEKGGRGPANVQFLDLATFQPLPYKIAGRNRFSFDEGSNTALVRASADGRIFALWQPRLSPAGLLTLTLNGEEVQQALNEEGAGHLLPAPDGSVLYTGQGILTPAGQPGGSSKVTVGCCLPATHGPYYLSLKPRDGPDSTTATLTLHLAGSERPLDQVNDFDLPNKIDPKGRELFLLDRRLFLIPGAGVLISIPRSNDQLVVQKWNVDQALDRAGFDYLVVTSRAPTLAFKGKPLNYPIAARARRGPAQFQLASGPPGLEVSPQGLVEWKVPADFAAATAPVRIKVKDAGGQEVVHAFMLTVVD